MRKMIVTEIKILDQEKFDQIPEDEKPKIGDFCGDIQEVQPEKCIFQVPNNQNPIYSLTIEDKADKEWINKPRQFSIIYHCFDCEYKDTFSSEIEMELQAHNLPHSGTSFTYHIDDLQDGETPIGYHRTKIRKLTKEEIKEDKKREWELKQERNNHNKELEQWTLVLQNLKTKMWRVEHEDVIAETREEAIKFWEESKNEKWEDFYECEINTMASLSICFSTEDSRKKCSPEESEFYFLEYNGGLYCASSSTQQWIEMYGKGIFDLDKFDKKDK